MTLEERAEEYIKLHNWILPGLRAAIAKRAYIAGAEAMVEKLKCCGNCKYRTHRGVLEQCQSCISLEKQEYTKWVEQE